jgi:hypothetical protein
LSCNEYYYQFFRQDFNHLHVGLKREEIIGGGERKFNDEAPHNLVLPYLHTELSPSWEAANCAAIQEILSILRNLKVHHRVHKSPPLLPVLSQIDPVHNISSYLSKIHFNIVHPHTSWSSQWFLSFWLSYMYSSSPPFVLQWRQIWIFNVIRYHKIFMLRIRGVDPT